ncbi:MAG: 4Fe-4S binding protein [Bacteroidales bacterium]|nr:MAG: 4Fe-4S binding protein [Bacteroidales bacterium]
MKKIKINPYRLFFQLAIIGLLVYMGIRFYTDKNYSPDFETYCPLGGIQALSSYFVNNSLACSMTSVQIVMGLTLIAVIVLVSKLFCSFICPIGTISEWIGRLGEKLKMCYTITGIADKGLRSLKYIILFITFYFSITSSELFCKKFDPYYATTSGFDSDVSIIMAITAIALVILGSFYIRLFWCKYICPLGALSNIFRFFILFIGLTGLYATLTYSGIDISFVWLLALLSITAYLLELLSIDGKVFPLLKITRNTATCTSCQLCSRICPQAIDVASQRTVKHVDCNMCGDCLHVCPEKDTLAINRKGKKWLPAFILAILITIGIIIGKSFEVPTISQYWGDIKAKHRMSIYEQSGLKNIKCFGSSSSFANKMRRVKGVTGVSTYVATHTVKIWFNPSEIDTLGIQESIFVPVKVAIKKGLTEADSVSVFSLKVDNFFDPYDTNYLTMLLKQNRMVLGFTSEFDCPVRVTVYTLNDSSISEESIKNLVEQKQVEKTYSDNATQIIDLRYRVVRIERASHSISGLEYNRTMK